MLKTHFCTKKGIADFFSIALKYFSIVRVMFSYFQIIKNDTIFSKKKNACIKIVEWICKIHGINGSGMEVFTTPTTPTSKVFGISQAH